jgi:hypothetical protein
MSLQQMRHTKLWFAGNARNWDLAGYEFDELKEGFENVARGRRQVRRRLPSRGSARDDMLQVHAHARA